MRLRIVLILLVFPVASLADLEMRFSDGTVALVRDGHVLLGNDESAILYRSEEEDLIVISRKERNWLRMGEDFDQAVTAQIRSEQEQILASVPPEQRAMIEEQMQGMVRPEAPRTARTVVLRTGRKATVAGYDCEEAEIKFDGDPATDSVCIATARELGIDDADFESLDAALRRVADLSSLNADDGPEADLEQMGGFPIRSRELPLGDVSELTSINDAAIDKTRLEVPAEFTEVTLDDMLLQ